MEESRKLVEGASRGDASAVETLLASHLPALRRYVDRRAGRALLEKESSSDLVQSVCRELFEGLASERFEYRGEREFKQWLYGAVLLKLEGRRRHWHAEKRDVAREARPGVPDAAISQGLFEPAVSATPSAAAMQHEEVDRLRTAIAALPEHYREIVELAHVAGLSHREIAVRLSISETNSRVLLSRALARLATIGARPRQA